MTIYRDLHQQEHYASKFFIAVQRNRLWIDKMQFTLDCILILKRTS